jgi:hypothetical protein
MIKFTSKEEAFLRQAFDYICNQFPVNEKCELEFADDGLLKSIKDDVAGGRFIYDDNIIQVYYKGKKEKFKTISQGIFFRKVILANMIGIIYHEYRHFMHRKLNMFADEYLNRKICFKQKLFDSNYAIIESDCEKFSHENTLKFLLSQKGFGKIHFKIRTYSVFGYSIYFWKSLKKKKFFSIPGLNPGYIGFKISNSLSDKFLHRKQ